MTFSQLYISSGSQKFYFDFCNNMRTLFTMLGIALWVEIYCRRTVLTDQCAWKPLWRHSNVLLKGDNLCIGMYISVYVLLAVYIKHSKELFLFSNVQNYTVLKALQFRWPVVLFWCWIFFQYRMKYVDLWSSSSRFCFGSEDCLQTVNKKRENKILQILIINSQSIVNNHQLNSLLISRRKGNLYACFIFSIICWMYTYTLIKWYKVVLNWYNELWLL